MKIDLAAQVKAAGKTKRKTVEVQPFTASRANEQELARLYLKVFKVWVKGIRERILPEYRRSLKEAKLLRDSALDLELLISEVEGSVLAAILTFRNEVMRWLGKVQNQHLTQLISKLKYATGVDLSTQMSGRDVSQTLEDILMRNVGLVRNVSDQARGRIGDIVFRGLQNRTSIKKVASELNEAVGLGWDRSLRIASDQTVKLSAALDEERQNQLGIDSFEWMHSGKKHFRVEHKERDGKIFKWSSEIGRNDPPGFAPFCGCKAKGVLEL